MCAMEHSIAARFAARPAASFPRPSMRVRERRLGLGSAIAFRPISGRATVLHLGPTSAVARLRGRTRMATPTPSRRPTSGRPRPAVVMTWSRSVPATGRTAVAALWRA